MDIQDFIGTFENTWSKHDGFDSITFTQDAYTTFVKGEWSDEGVWTFDGTVLKLDSTKHDTSISYHNFERKDHNYIIFELVTDEGEAGERVWEKIS